MFRRGDDSSLMGPGGHVWAARSLPSFRTLLHVQSDNYSSSTQAIWLAQCTSMTSVTLESEERSATRRSSEGTDSHTALLNQTASALSLTPFWSSFPFYYYSRRIQKGSKGKTSDPNRHRLNLRPATPCGAVRIAPKLDNKRVAFGETSSLS